MELLQQQLRAAEQQNQVPFCALLIASLLCQWWIGPFSVARKIPDQLISGTGFQHEMSGGSLRPGSGAAGLSAELRAGPAKQQGQGRCSCHLERPRGTVSVHAPPLTDAFKAIKYMFYPRQKGLTQCCCSYAVCGCSIQARLEHRQIFFGMFC